MYNVLLVDDKEIFLRTLKRMPFFQENKDELQVAWTSTSAREALAILRRDQVDIVMTDINMPLMSGLDLLKVIRQENLCSCTILVSEYTEFSYAREGILYGAFDYIVKPLDDSIVSETLSRALILLKGQEGQNTGDRISAEDLVRMLFIHEDKEFETQIRKAGEALADAKAPRDAVRNIRTIQNAMIRTLTTEHANIEKYIPFDFIFSLPVPTGNAGTDPVADDARGAIARLLRSLRFLHRKMPLFHLESENDQIRNIWYYTIGKEDEPCRLSDTAQTFFLNPSYLSTLFKREAGVSYKTFVQNLKMERARFLLAFSGKKSFRNRGPAAFFRHGILPQDLQGLFGSLSCKIPVRRLYGSGNRVRGDSVTRPCSRPCGTTTTAPG